MCKCSIVTVCRNNKVGLEKTIESVLNQSFKNFEFVIIDGDSNDGTIDVLRSYGNQITYWISEPDKGIYNAMNKGINISNGEYILFLNSGDILSAEFVLSSVFEKGIDSDIIYGNLLIREPGKDDWIKYYNEKLSFDYFTRDTLPHQGAFIKKELFEKYGTYDEQLKICADWKFFMDAICLHHVSAMYIDQVIAIYDYTGISSRKEYHAQQKEEKRLAIQQTYPLYYEGQQELDSLRALKAHYEDLTGNFFVRKIFALMVKGRMLKKKIRNTFRK